MKKTMVMLVMLIVMVPMIGFSADKENYVIGQAGVFNPNDFDNGTDGFDRGPEASVAMGRMITKNMALEVGADYTRCSIDYMDDGIEPNVAVQTLGIPLTIKIFSSVSKQVSIYSGFGVGCYYSNVTFRHQTTPRHVSGYAIGYQAVVGADAMLTDCFGITTGLKYTKINQNSLSDDVNYDVEMGGLSSSVGVKVLF